VLNFFYRVCSLLHGTGQMTRTPQDLFAYLAGLGIETTTVTHEPVFTVEESQDLRGKISGAHTKNLFLWDRKSGYFLVTALESATVSLKGLHRKIGAAGRLSFGSAEAMLEMLGVTPGAVTPFGLVNDTGRRVSFILDPNLARADVINCHPLVNTMTTSIRTPDLVRFLEATGHPPQVIDLSE
jgi:Ala-tRNA(Pro) deacylase